MDIKQFWDNIASKKIALCGIGISNTPLIMNFLEKGARVYACDRRTREQIGELADKIEAAGAELRLGENNLDDLEVDIIFRTPGMSFYMPELSDARKKGIAVTSEMEVFFDLCPATIFAVTGSDGKPLPPPLLLKCSRHRVKPFMSAETSESRFFPKLRASAPTTLLWLSFPPSSLFLCERVPMLQW